jgi:hypothetical protein
MAFGDFTVTRASTKLRIGSNGLYGSVANNVPAFEFNEDGTYRGLLVEPGATNRVRNNSMVGAVVAGAIPTNWTQQTVAGVSVAVDALGTEIGVDYIDFRVTGTASASGSYRIAFDTNTSNPASVGQVWTGSFWSKLIAEPGNRPTVSVTIVERDAVGSFLTSGDTVFVPTSTLTRYSGTRTLNNALTAHALATFRMNIASGTTYDFTIRIGWPQMETGSVATSPIVTTAGTASRVADVVSLTGASSLIGQSAGTVFLEFSTPSYAGNATSRRLFTLSDGTAGNRIFCSTITDTFAFGVVLGGSNQGTIADTTAMVANTVRKYAFAYDTNDLQFYVNGASVGTDTSATIPATSRIDIGQGQAGTEQVIGWIRSVALFPTRLTTAQCNALTTL